MKKYTLTLLLLFSVFYAQATDRLKFKISKPLCVLTFLQAASGDQHISQTLISYIRGHVSKEDEAELNRVSREFSKLDLKTSYNFTIYPDSRQKPRNIMNIVTMAAVQTDNIKDCMERIVGIMPNEQWLKLKDIFTSGEILYDKIIGESYNGDLQQQLTSLKTYSSKGDSIFTRLKRFYGSTWGDDIPFTVALYAVPGKRGYTTATPHSNSLVLAVNTEEHDHAMRVGIAFHEICHVLYEEQPVSLQQQIDSLFSESISPFARYAYGYFDEALATAAGNGWAYKELSGKMDKTQWYNDAYINGYAHELYPMVQEYIEQGKRIDKAFIEQAIKLFEQRFPDATREYMNLFNKINLYTDASNRDENGTMINVLGNHFRISSLSSSYPVKDPETLNMVRQSAGTQLFFLHTGDTADFKAIQDIFPQLKDASTATNGIYSFFDEKQRPVIVIIAPDEHVLDKAIKILEKSGKMNKDKTFIGLD